MNYKTGEDLAVIQKNLGEISFEDQKVLVTGGAGFLGSWMCEVLIAQNARVICLDNLASGQEQNIGHLKKNENFSFLRDVKPGYGNEIQLTDALRRFHEPLGLVTNCRRYDIGDKLGWMKSSIELTLDREDFATEMRKFLNELLVR